MATYSHDTLALAQVANSQTDICDPPSGQTYLIHNITVHNTNTTTETVEIWKHNGSTAFQIAKFSIVTNETIIFSFGNDGLVLDGSHKLQAKTTTASKVSMDISGTKVVL